MITKRLLAVELVVLVGLSAIFLLPPAPKNSPAGVAMKLPIWVGNWLGEDTAVTQREIDILAKDTQFARKVYTSPQGDKIFVSIVLSGDDMTSSIHRPERCLPAQGWSLLQSSQRAVEIPDAGPLRVTRLSNAREVTAGPQRFTLHNLTYYWFIGYDAVTPSHFSRTVIDLRDRILHGFDQRWAYVTVAGTVMEGFERGGKSEAETGAMIEAFVKQLAPKLQRPNGAPVMLVTKK